MRGNPAALPASELCPVPASHHPQAGGASGPADLGPSFPSSGEEKGGLRPCLTKRGAGARGPDYLHERHLRAERQENLLGLGGIRVALRVGRGVASLPGRGAGVRRRVRA